MSLMSMDKVSKNFTLKQLNILFEYKNKILYWKTPTNTRIIIGSRVFKECNQNSVVKIYGKRYNGALICFSIDKGYIPKIICWKKDTKNLHDTYFMIDISNFNFYNLNEIKKVLEYDKNKGILFWKINFKKYLIGEKAGYINNGYEKINFMNQWMYSHILVWLFENKTFPKNEIDHINHIRNDNRIENLRDVSHKINGRNMSRHKDTKLKKVGITLLKSGNYRSSLGGHIGVFSTEKKAIKARNDKMNKEGYHENHK